MKEYKYRICKSTFSPTGKEDDWARLINNALMQWQEATDGFITMKPERKSADPSHADYNEYEECTLYPVFTGATDPFTFLVELGNRMGGDDGLSEIRMVDPPSPKDNVHGSFIEMLLTDPFKACILFPDFIACVSSYTGFLENPQRASTELPSADIIFNQDAIVPPSPTPAIEPNIPVSVHFNTCSNSSVPDPNDSSRDDHFFAYASAVHEAGHALGLTGGLTIDAAVAVVFSVLKAYSAGATMVSLPLNLSEEIYKLSHATSTESVMNYDHITGVQEPDCSPHPLDVMAIFALYQHLPAPATGP